MHGFLLALVSVQGFVGAERALASSSCAVEPRASVQDGPVGRTAPTTPAPLGKRVAARSWAASELDGDSSLTLACVVARAANPGSPFVVFVSRSQDDGRVALIQFDPDSGRVVSRRSFDDPCFDYVCGARVLVVPDQDEDGIQEILCTSEADQSHGGGPHVIVRLLSGANLEVLATRRLFAGDVDGFRWTVAPFSERGVAVVGPLKGYGSMDSLKARVLALPSLALGAEHALDVHGPSSRFAFAVPSHATATASDLIVGVSGEGRLALKSVHMSDPTPSWTAELQPTQPGWPEGLVTSDVDRLGTPDVLVAFTGSDDSSVFCLSAETGKSLWHAPDGAPGRGAVTMIGDVNGDEVLDVALASGSGASRTSGGLTILDGRSGEKLLTWAPTDAALDVGARAKALVGGAPMLFLMDGYGRRLWKVEVTGDEVRPDAARD